jgi:hypothetical protein
MMRVLIGPAAYAIAPPFTYKPIIGRFPYTALPINA